LALPTSRPYQGRKAWSFRGRVRLSGVAFAYGRTPLLKQIDLDLNPGTVTVITGANGSGKTTLIQLILATLKPQGGEISAEGHSYEELDLAVLREATSFVAQEPIIFDGTIEENIRYGRPDASRRDMERAARLAGAESFILASEEGYARVVGDNGVLLSGGERQRIALARALIARPQLLIMDEPTNHLDAAAVAALLPALRAQDQAPTILIMSHERALIAGADHLFELADGRLRSMAETLGGVVALHGGRKSD
jgi:ABC-type multidrug transport system fused ATPase/permease subunit